LLSPARICETPLEAGWIPGQKAGYHTSSSWFILGEIIRRLDGRPLELVVREEILIPLGMIDSLNHEDPAKLDRMATVYRGQRGADGMIAFTQGFTPGDAPDFPFVRASGGLISTASDYARFLEMYRLGGTLEGRRILRAESTRAAIQPRAKMSDSSSYGYGWMVRSDGTYSHTGSDGTMGGSIRGGR
jgi:CubicO group peptidase (beta-lactamase class C family)